MTTTKKAFVGTQPVASLHRRSVAKDAIETTVTYATSSTLEMHAAKSKASVEIGSVKSKNHTMKGTMIIMVFNQPHREQSPEAGRIPGGAEAYSLDLKRDR
jgi:hypothetical protein